MIKKVSTNKKPPKRILSEKEFERLFFISLRVAGYKKRYAPMKDWVKREPDGRFHLVQFKKGLWEMHFDTDGIDCDHYSIRMPYKVTKELVRIIGINNSLKVKRKDEQQSPTL